MEVPKSLLRRAHGAPKTFNTLKGIKIIKTEMTKNRKSDLQEALILSKGAFFYTAGFSMVINFLMLVPAIYMLQLYDRVVPTGNHSTLLMLTLIMLVFLVTLGSLEWVRSQILVRTSTKLDVLLNKRLFQVAFKQALYTGGQRATTQPLEDLSGLRQFMSSNGLFAFFDVPWIPVYIGVMFMFHPWYGWVAVFIAIILGVLAVITEKTTGKISAEANNQAISNRGMVNKSLRNVEVIESMGMLENIYQRWLKGSIKTLKLQSVASSRSRLLTALSKTIRMSAQSLILALGAYLVIRHEITPGLMIAGSILLGRALAPIDLMIASWKGFITARGQYRRLNEILLNIPVDKDKMQLPTPQGKLTLEAAVVIPPGAKKPVIKGLNLTVEQGDIVGVLGPSGAGKSTLARALLGIWPTRSGAIRLDGADVSAWDRQQLGEFIGYLPQDIELFEGSVSENIARFGEVKPEKVVEAAKMADVHELILHLSEGYDTAIGSGGMNLSAGQRQRIGLARALYNTPVLIVLDEPNSNLDEQGEKALKRCLQKLKVLNSTVIIVTHRSNILENVDKLLILKDGELVVYGAREKVIAHLQQKSLSMQSKA